MKAELKALYSPDVDLDTYNPGESNVFGFLLQAMIGPENHNSSESFQIYVCSPEWIRIKRSDRDMIWGRHMLIVLRYDINNIRKLIQDTIGKYSADSWEVLAEKIGRFGGWEFEDYRPSA